MRSKATNFLDSDAQLVLKFKGGDRESFEKLIEKYQRLVINTAHRMLGDRAEAEDIAQEVFLRIYNRPQSYKPKARFSTWLLRVTKNLCLNRLREKRRHPLVSLNKDIETEEGKISRDIPAPAQERPDVSLERKELQDLIKGAVDSLPPKQRMVVILAKYDGLPYQEIAKVIGCSVTAVKLLLHRAKVTLKERLAPYLEKK